MKLRAPAKINLYLKVKGKRPDGYHNIETLFERLNLFDEIVLRKQKKGISVSSNDKDLPCNRKNLCYKAALLLKKKYGVDCGVKINIVKRIPVASGLGGGSSDAASTLSGLNRMWNLELPGQKLIELGKSLGADVPFFLLDKNFAIGKKRGDELRRVNFKNKFWHIIISPDFKVFTKEIYSMFDMNKDRVGRHLRPTRSNKGNMDTLLKALKNKNFQEISENITNDLENIVLKKKPNVSMLKQALGKIGSQANLVSGSGPSVFGLFETRKEAVAAKRSLKKSFPAESRNWKIFVVATY